MIDFCLFLKSRVTTRLQTLNYTIVTEKLVKMENSHGELISLTTSEMGKPGASCFVPTLGVMVAVLTDRYSNGTRKSEH